MERRLAEAAETVRAELAKLADIPAAEWSFFADRLWLRRARKRALLLRQGEVEPSMRFLLRGICRYFCLRDGREIVLGFDAAGRWAAAYDSLVAAAPSLFSIEALTEVEFAGFDGSLLPVLYRRHACWERVGRRILENEWVRKVRKESEIRALTPRERHARLVARCGPWLAEVPQYHIASFLGIAPETLSRMRVRARRS